MIKEGFTVRPEHVQSYEQDGATKLEDLLRPEFVSKLLGACDELHARFERLLTAESLQTGGVHAGLDPEGRPYMYFGEFAVGARLDGWSMYSFLGRDIDVFRDIASSVELADVVRTLIRSREVRYWADEVFVKHADSDSNATPWHHDIAAYAFKGRQIPTLWLALTDIDANSSPLQTIRGSHLHGLLYPPPRRAQEPLLEGYSAAPNFAELTSSSRLPITTWQLNAGDAVVFHPCTVHGAPANRSSRRRVAVATRWLGDDAELRPDEYSNEDRLLCCDGCWTTDHHAKQVLYPIAGTRAATNG